MKLCLYGGWPARIVDEDKSIIQIEPATVENGFGCPYKAEPFKAKNKLTPINAIDLNRIAVKGLIFTGYGYVIDEDGTIYSLTQAYMHGVALALLYPEWAEKHGYFPPNDDHIDVFHYQRLILDHGRELRILTISHGTNLRIGNLMPTDEQIEAARQAMVEAGADMRSKIRTDWGDCKLSTMKEHLQEYTMTEEDQCILNEPDDRGGLGNV